MINGLSQKDLARRLGIDPSTLAKWELGKRRPSEETIGRLMNLQKSLPLCSALSKILQAVLEKRPTSKITENLDERKYLRGQGVDTPHPMSINYQLNFAELIRRPKNI
jgi:transcriptional regulator with XRE-family HTH domain